VVVHRAAAGHIGMVAGRNAQAALWRPFLAWLRQLPARRTPRAKRVTLHGSKQ
jgi:hypothetical protein